MRDIPKTTGLFWVRPDHHCPHEQRVECVNDCSCAFPSYPGVVSPSQAETVFVTQKILPVGAILKEEEEEETVWRPIPSRQVTVGFRLSVAVDRSQQEMERYMFLTHQDCGQLEHLSAKDTEAL
eukprot:scaffold20447_cov200-Amphora_coffeaeformis.AAC.1